MPRECTVCDGTGSLCPTCGDSAHGCPCRGGAVARWFGL